MKETNTDRPLLSNNKLPITLDLRFVTAALLLVVIGMLFAWHPWAATHSSKDQVVTVSGDAKITDTPDEYVFYPSYPVQNASKDAALAQLTQKSNDVVAGLKKLGVADSKIKADSSGYDYPVMDMPPKSDATYTLNITVTVNNKDLSQKVQDYLLTTAPSGAVSPQAGFSQTLRKAVESRARDAATKDARAKAEQMASNLGFKVGKVKSVSDNQNFGGPIEGGVSTMSVNDASVSKPQMAIQPGQNDLNYSVQVTYYIR